jgi:hypothetical protein
MSQPTETLVTGVVVAEGTPVAGATVRVQTSAVSTLSDQRGGFTLRLSAPPEGARVVASKAGYFIGSANFADRPVSIELRRHPVEDNPDYAWVDPRPDAADAGRCANCHQEIFDEWSASAHARSATNGRFLNVYEGSDRQGNRHVGWSLLDDLPSGAGVCYSCHFPSPSPSIETTVDLRQVAGVDRLGVHCDLCHKIADVSVDEVGIDHGRFAMTFLRPNDEHQVFFGPLEDVARGEDIFHSLYRESRYCASCHEGVLFGTHVYGTYSEWLASPHAKEGVQCQDCHMAPTGRMANFAPGKGGLRRDASSLASHRLPGADGSFLRDHLSLSIAARLVEAGLEVETIVSVHGVGHRTPTGSPTRALILHVEAIDDDGRAQPLVEGDVLPGLAGDGPIESGGLAGRPGRFYAKVLADADGELGVPFWRSASVAYDTRLEPDEANRSRFVFECRSGTAQVRASLVYRRFNKEMADAKGWTDNEITIETRSCDVNESQPRFNAR